MIDYDGVVSRDEFRRAMQCFADQTCKDFEILVYHDGPKQHPYSQDVTDIEGLPDVRFFETEARENNWGHSNRDRGIHAAQGEWLIMTNADNVFYPEAVETLKVAAESNYKPKFERRWGNWLQRELWRKRYRSFDTLDQAQIMVFPIILKGCAPVRNSIRRFRGTEHQHEILLSGVPVALGRIDAMQFVMRRETWLAEGGWADKREMSDGYQYTEFAKKYGIMALTKVLGEHW